MVQDTSLLEKYKLEKSLCLNICLHNEVRVLSIINHILVYMNH